MALEQSGGTVLQKFDYYYGFANGQRQSDYNNGNVISVTELDGSKTTYSYDDLNRLVVAVRTGTSPYTEGYTYDLNDNRTGITRDGTTTNATYDDANQMTSMGGTSYSYDRDGNLISFDSNTLTYDAANKWVGGSINGNSVSFGYDGLGRRISSTFGTAATREYWYDQSGLGLETTTTGDNIVFLRTPSGRLLSRWFSPVLVNYGTDRLGSVTALTGTDQSLQHTYNYRPYGEMNYQTGSRYNPYHYTGSYYDSQTALYQMGARYYDQSAGRFTQVDPIGGGYIYTGCNPVNSTDPTGLAPSACFDAVASFIFTTVADASLALGPEALIAYPFLKGGSAFLVSQEFKTEAAKNPSGGFWVAKVIIEDIAGSGFPIVSDWFGLLNASWTCGSEIFEYLTGLSSP